MESEKLVYTADELAELLGCSRRHLLNHTEPRGSLKVFRMGRSVKYLASDVRAWLAQISGRGDEASTTPAGAA